MAKRGIFSKIRWCFYALILAAMFTYNWYEAPFKVKDPAEPGFNPDKFRFMDYKTRDEMKYAFKMLFPPGTDMVFVDQVLIKAGGADKQLAYVSFDLEPKYKRVIYIESENFLRSIKGRVAHNFLYDEKNMLINVLAFLGQPVFENAPSLKELTAEKYKMIQHCKMIWEGENNE